MRNLLFAAFFAAAAITVTGGVAGADVMRDPASAVIRPTGQAMVKTGQTDLAGGMPRYLPIAEFESFGHVGPTDSKSGDTLALVRIYLSEVGETDRWAVR